MKQLGLFVFLLSPLAQLVACTSTDEARTTTGTPKSHTAATPQGPCDSLGQGAHKDSLILDNVYLYRTYLDQKDTMGALGFWRYVYREAPGYDEGVFSQGISMYKTLIRLEADSLQREELIDTLFMLWDKRIECTGKTCYGYGRKAVDMITYRRTAVKEIKALFDKAWQGCGDSEIESFVITYVITFIGPEITKGNVTCDSALAMYDRVIRIARSKEDNAYHAYYKQAEEAFVTELTRRGCMDCGKLVPIFSQRLAAEPDNADLWRQAWSNLKTCKDQCNDTMMAAFSKLLDAEPSAELAKWIFSCLVKQERYREALPYGEKAVEIDTVADTKAALALNVAQVYQKLGNYPKSREWAYKALAIKPGWGEPYIHIGYLYAASGGQCSSEPFGGKTVFWPAMDMWEKAKGDPATAGEAATLISRYWSAMPSMTNLFEGTADLNESHKGKSYKVGCWIQETTIVRTSD